jgi:hypothetical protein
MVLAGIKVVDTPLVHDAMELARNSSEPYLFNHPDPRRLRSVQGVQAGQPDHVLGSTTASSARR